MHGTEIINGCSRNSSTSFGEPGGPDYYHLWPVCQESKVYCHHVAVDCHGICETHDYLKIIGNFVLAANASFLYCFVVSASLLGTGWQLLNLAFYFFCLVQSACKKKKKTDGAQTGAGSDTDSDIEFWDIAAGADKVQQTMKEHGWAFEIGYYYAVGLVIFAIVIFYSVHFPPVSFAGLLYFNCKVRLHIRGVELQSADADRLVLCVCGGGGRRRGTRSILSTSTTFYTYILWTHGLGMCAAVARWGALYTTWCCSRSVSCSWAWLPSSR